VPIRPERESALALCLVALAFALRAGFAGVLPLLQAPDEAAHAAFVAYVVEERRLPVHGSESLEEALRYSQRYQPPLAYLSFAPLAALARELGATPAATLRALRLQNALYGALLVWLGYAVARRLTPEGDPLRLAAPLLLAGWPGLVAAAGSLNNDTLACVLVSAAWLAWLGGAAPRRRALAAGALFGAACLAKLTALTQAPLLLLGPLWLGGRGARAALRDAALAGLVALALALPWLARNVALYGDPLALGVGSVSFERLQAEWPGAPPALPAPDPAKALFQLFGRFGVANNLSVAAVPALWLPLCALGAAGWWRARRGAASLAPARWGAACAAAVLCAAAGLVAFSLRYYGGWQGRYLFVAAVPLALLAAEGLTRWLAPRAWLRALLALLALLLALHAALAWKLSRHFATTPGPEWSARARL
jgi:hypothetical protein